MCEIKQNFLNPRHKAVYLNNKGGVYLLEYCINKGHLLNKEIIQEKIIGAEIYVTLLHITYLINGYYVYIDIKLNINNGFNSQSALYWKDEEILKECRFNCYGHGISIEK